VATPSRTTSSPLAPPPHHPHRHGLVVVVAVDVLVAPVDKVTAALAQLLTQRRVVAVAVVVVALAAGDEGQGGAHGAALGSVVLERSHGGVAVVGFDARAEREPTAALATLVPVVGRLVNVKAIVSCAEDVTKIDQPTGNPSKSNLNISKFRTWSIRQKSWSIPRSR
jgi:hypothetical protein